MKTMQEIDIIYRAEMSRARHEGQQQGKVEMILRQLTRRVGSRSLELQDKIKALPLDRLNNLAEDLMDFSQPGDLVSWLDRHQD